MKSKELAKQFPLRACPRALACMVALLLAACQSGQYRSVNTEVLAEIEQALETSRQQVGPSETTGQAPEEVLQALVPGLSLSSAALQPVEERFDFSVQQPM